MKQEAEKLMSDYIQEIEAQAAEIEKLKAIAEGEIYARNKAVDERDRLRAELQDAKEQVSDCAALYENSKQQRKEIIALQSKCEIYEKVVIAGAKYHHDGCTCELCQAILDASKIGEAK